MLQGEHSAILSTFIKLPFIIKIFFFFEWPLKTGFTVFYVYCLPLTVNICFAVFSSLNPDEEEEERKASYESYRILVENECAGCKDFLCFYRTVDLDKTVFTWSAVGAQW